MNVNDCSDSAENIDPDSDDDAKHDPAPARPFPIDAMPDPIQRFVGEIARAKDIDPLMVLMPTLAVLSGAIGNARRLRLRSDYYAPAVLWPVLIASSGDGKSPAWDASMKPLVDLQAEASRQYDAELSAHREATSEWKSKPKNERGSEPIAPTLAHHYLSDATIEAIGVRLLDTPRGLLVSVDEFAGLTGSLGQYKGGKGNDLQSLLSFYDARSAKIDRKASIPPTIFIPRAFVAITGTIQIPVLRTLLNPLMIGCGFAARLLLAMPTIRRRKWIDADPDCRVVDQYGRIVRDLRSIDHDPAHPRHVTPTDAAMNLWRAWIDETEGMRVEADGDAMRAAIPKLCDVAARLALIYHLVDAIDGVPGVYPDRLDERSMTAGIECARWFIAEAERIYDRLSESSEDSERRELLDWIRRAGGSITSRELAHRARRHREAGAAEAALDALVGDGLAERVVEPTGGRGRPATIYRLIR